MLLAAALALSAATPRHARAVSRPDSTHLVRICAGGDVTLGTNLDEVWMRTARQKYGPELPPAQPESLLAPLRPLLAGADIVLLNIEGAIGEGPALTKCGPKSTSCFAFRQPVGAAAALRAVAGDAELVGNVANNHARDAGPDGLDVSQAHLASAGIWITGADTMPTIVTTPRGDTVAVLGFSTSGVPDLRDLAAVRRYVQYAAAHYDRVIVTMHLGAEGSGAQHVRNANERFVGGDRGNPIAFAATAVAAGADLVIGHGPHVVRAGEWRGDALVLYSLGNLLTYGPFTLSEPLNRGAVACVLLDGAGKASDGEIRATYQRAPGAVGPDPARRAAKLIDALSRADLRGRGVRVDSGGRILRAAPEPRSGRVRKGKKR